MAVAVRCPRCDLKLVDGRCPATEPLTPFQGQDWGTAQQLVHHLGDDITTAMVRRWRDPDRHGLTTLDGLSPLDEAARIERDARLNPRGRPRRLDLVA